MNYLKPRSPLKVEENYIYPITTGDQIEIGVNHDKLDPLFDNALGIKPYSDQNTYNVGDVCYHNSTCYKCTTSISSAEAWNINHWEVYDINSFCQKLNLLSNYSRRTRLNITSNLSNLSNAVAEQNLEKYGYSIGDYFIGASGYVYHLADMDTYFGNYSDHSVVGTHHIGIVVDTKTTSAWLSSGTLTSYNKSTLHTLLKGTVLNNIKSDFNSLFGNWSNHMIYHYMLDNAIGSWGDSWVANTYIAALSEVQVFGASVFSADSFQTGSANKQLELFRKFRYNEIYGNASVWLKSISTASAACVAGNSGLTNNITVSGNHYVSGLILFY